MQVDDFDFNLPDKNIALRPCEPRDHARLLVLPHGAAPQDQHIYDLPQILRSGDLLVVNNTRVLPARLSGIRRRDTSEAKVEITLIKRRGATQWQAMARPAKRLRAGDRIEFGGLCAQVISRSEAYIEVAFDVAAADMENALFAAGEMPLPPYIASRRAADDRDQQDYQTRFARHDGAVAAPTAGLHFTDRLMADLAAHNIAVEEVTLHVGAGTFLPVNVTDILKHKMHSEWGEVGSDVVEKIKAQKARGGRVIAVGTTSLRILESAAQTSHEGLEAFSGDTDIFIYPGYKFRVIDGLITNFHLPRSTLFMLVCALAGTHRMKQAYAHAIEQDYRFYSYGDACFLERFDEI